MTIKKFCCLLRLNIACRGKLHMRLALVLALCFFFLLIVISLGSSLSFSLDNYVNQADETVAYRQLSVEADEAQAAQIKQLAGVNDIQKMAESEYVLLLDDYRDRQAIIDEISRLQLGDVSVDAQIFDQENALSQTKKLLLSVFLFVSVAMLLIIHACVNQFIGEMSRDIALWMAVGYRQKHILLVLWSQIFGMALSGLLAGVVLASLLSRSIFTLVLRRSELGVLLLDAPGSTAPFIIGVLCTMLVVALVIALELGRKTKGIDAKQMFAKEL